MKSGGERQVEGSPTSPSSAAVTLPTADKGLPAGEVQPVGRPAPGRPPMARRGRAGGRRVRADLQDDVAGIAEHPELKGRNVAGQRLVPGERDPSGRSSLPGGRSARRRSYVGENRKLWLTPIALTPLARAASVSASAFLDGRRHRFLDQDVDPGAMISPAAAPVALGEEAATASSSGPPSIASSVRRSRVSRCDAPQRAGPAKRPVAGRDSRYAGTVLQCLCVPVGDVARTEEIHPN